MSLNITLDNTHYVTINEVYNNTDIDTKKQILQILDGFIKVETQKIKEINTNTINNIVEDIINDLRGDKHV